jgi:predicted NodU family carbamoyl transferase
MIIKYGNSLGLSFRTKPTKNAKSKNIPKRHTINLVSKMNGKVMCCSAKRNDAMNNAFQLFPIFCVIFGLVGLKDEGKIMGLAAQGQFDEKIFNQLKYLIDNDIYASGWILVEYYQKMLKIKRKMSKPKKGV